MARTSKAEKAKTHETLLAIAAEQLRRAGYAGLNVSDVMSSAGMTHGGFYRHFKNKEDLAVSATRKAFDVFIEGIERDIAENSADVALSNFVDRYLSMQHLGHVETGCPVAALIGDAGRCSANERKELELGTRRLTATLTKAVERCERTTEISGSTLLGMLAGTLSMARLQNDTAKQEETLSSTRRALSSLGLTT